MVYIIVTINLTIARYLPVLEKYFYLINMFRDSKLKFN